MSEIPRIRWTPGQARTLPEMISDAVRSAIMRGDLAPGEPIQVGRLARSMKVSTGPLREALRTLAGEGLIEYTPRRGVRVREVTPEEMHELGDIIVLLDTLAFHEATLRMTPEVLETAERLHRRLSEESDPARWLPILLQLRQTLLEPCGRPHLLELILSLRARAERVNRVLYSTPAGRQSMIVGWRVIIDAMKTGDPERVAGTLAERLQVARAVGSMGEVALPPRVHIRIESATDGLSRARERAAGAPDRKRRPRSAVDRDRIGEAP